MNFPLSADIIWKSLLVRHEILCILFLISVVIFKNLNLCRYFEYFMLYEYLYVHQSYCFWKMVCLESTIASDSSTYFLSQPIQNWMFHSLSFSILSSCWSILKRVASTLNCKTLSVTGFYFLSLGVLFCSCDTSQKFRYSVDPFIILPEDIYHFYYSFTYNLLILSDLFE